MAGTVVLLLRRAAPQVAGRQDEAAMPPAPPPATPPAPREDPVEKTPAWAVPPWSKSESPSSEPRPRHRPTTRSAFIASGVASVLLGIVGRRRRGRR
jgi:hypothetical protein